MEARGMGAEPYSFTLSSLKLNRTLRNLVLLFLQAANIPDGTLRVPLTSLAHSCLGLPALDTCTHTRVWLTGAQSRCLLRAQLLLTLSYPDHCSLHGATFPYPEGAQAVPTGWRNASRSQAADRCCQLQVAMHR